MAARSAPEGNKDTPTRTANRDNAEQATQARQSGQDAGHSRLAENVPSDQRVPEQVYADYAQNYDVDDAALNGRIPDVLLDAPVVSIKDLDIELDALQAKVSLFTKVLDLTELSAGIDAKLGNAKLTIESVEVQSLLKVRLDNVSTIVDRALTTNRPQPPDSPRYSERRGFCSRGGRGRRGRCPGGRRHQRGRLRHRLRDGLGGGRRRRGSWGASRTLDRAPVRPSRTSAAVPRC